MNGGGDSSQFFFYLIIILPILMYPLLSVAANPRIYGQMVTTLAKYSRFEAALKPKKTSVGRAIVDATEDTTVEAAFAQAKTQAKPTLTAKPRRIKPVQAAPDAPF